MSPQASIPFTFVKDSIYCIPTLYITLITLRSVTYIVQISISQR
jgi:hypothetical protein